MLSRLVPSLCRRAGRLRYLGGASGYIIASADQHQEAHDSQLGSQASSRLRGANLSQLAIRGLSGMASRGQENQHSTGSEPTTPPADASRPDLSRIPDLPSLLAMAEAGAKEWSAGTICAAFNIAAKLPGHLTDSDVAHPTMRVLSKAYLPHVPELTQTRHCTIPLWACAKAGYWEGGLAKALLARLGQDGGELLQMAGGQEHTHLWYALSWGPPEDAVAAAPELMQRSAAYIARMTAQQLNWQDCSGILISCAQMQHCDEPLLLHLTACLVEQPDANCYALAKSLKALAVLGCSGAEFAPDVRELCTKLQQRMQDPAERAQHPHELSNLLKTLEVLRPANTHAFIKTLAEECRRRNFGGFRLKELSQAALSLAKMGYTDQAWYAAAGAAAADPGVLRGAHPRHVYYLLYAFALARHRPSEDLLQALLAEPHLSSLRTVANSTVCSALLWSLAKLGLHGHGLAVAAKERLGELSGRQEQPPSITDPNLTHVSNLETLSAMAEAQARQWSASTVYAAFNATIKLALRDGDSARLHRTLELLSKAYLPHASQLTHARHCTIPLWACAKAGYWEGGLAKALLARLGQDGGDLLNLASGSDHASLWRTLTMGPPQDVVAAAAEPLRTSATCLLKMTAAELSPTVCSDVLQACARLQHRKHLLLHHLTACLVERPDAKGSDLSRSLHSLGKLADECSHKPRLHILRGLAGLVVERLGQQGMEQQQQAVERREGGDLQPDCDHFSPQSLSNMLWGCAKLYYKEPHLMQPLAAAVGHAAERMTGQGIAMSLYALAVLGCLGADYATTLQQLCAEVHSRKQKFNAYELSNILWALEKLRPANTEVLVQELAGECRRRQFAGFKPHDFRNIAWSLAKMAYSDEEWFEAAAEAAAKSTAEQDV